MPARKITISLPEELHGRMAGVDVIWSQVCQQAIRDKLEAIDAAKLPDLQNVIQRLKGLERMPVLDRAKGEVFGRRFAAFDATVQELRKLSELVSGKLWKSFISKRSDLPLRVRLFDAFADDWRKVHGGQSEGYFWHNHAPISLLKGAPRLDLIVDDFLVGFAEGAMATWEQISHMFR